MRQQNPVSMEAPVSAVNNIRNVWCWWSYSGIGIFWEKKLYDITIKTIIIII